MSPAQIAAAVLRVNETEIASVEAIKHGLTNDSWVVNAANASVVVRISSADERALQIDRANEALVLAAVEQAGLGPEVLLCDPARRVLVTRLAGRVWSLSEATAERSIDSIAQMLARLHSMLVPQGISSVDLSVAVSGYQQTLEARGENMGPTAQSLSRRALEIAHLLTAVSRPVLCHNDVHHLNIVESSTGVRLIDWEYAGVGEPLFDLASACVYHSYDKTQRERLLRAHSPDADHTDWHRLELACWLFEYIRELWMRVRQAEEIRDS
jgi:thiamine kinase